jgi:hypothetical protein
MGGVWGLRGRLMPYSEKQRVAAAIAEHEPGKLFDRNKGMLKMSHGEMHDLASGPVKKPKRVKSALVDRMMRG